METIKVKNNVHINSSNNSIAAWVKHHGHYLAMTDILADIMKINFVKETQKQIAIMFYQLGKA